MKQNKYDEASFFEKYSGMPRSVDGLNAAGEWHVLREMIPVLKDRNVLDLGCGFGWHCRYAREQGARQVVGIDISARMLERARQTTHDPGIEYRQMAIEDISFAGGSFDVVISSLALHYVEDYAAVCKKVYDCLSPGGAFVLSTEHPVFTAIAAQDWYHDEKGHRLHWPVDQYQQEGRRQTRFLDTDVVKYHRTLATLLHTLIQTGFRITAVSEPQPTAEVLNAYPEMKDETRRPIFLLISAVKPG